MAAGVDREAIEQTIHTVAVRRLGVVDTAIVRNFDRGSQFDEGGVWFLLSVKLPGDAAWTLIGRRRTKVELWGLVETLDRRHLGGRDFRTCWESTRGVGAR